MTKFEEPCIVLKLRLKIHIIICSDNCHPGTTIKYQSVNKKKFVLRQNYQNYMRKCQSVTKKIFSLRQNYQELHVD